MPRTGCLTIMHAQRVRPKLFFTSAVAAEPGVESELYSSTPRRVVHTRSTYRGHLWYVNFIVGFLLVAYYFWTKHWGEKGIGKEILIALSLFTGMMWLYASGKSRRNREFLQNGYAVRATVDRCEASDTEVGFTDIRYYYTAIDGKDATGYLTVSTDTIHRVGGFTVGTTFTLLLHPTERYEIRPYFLVVGAEIPGAAPIRTTPPQLAITNVA